MQEHSRKIEQLQQQITQKNASSPFALRYQSNNSNTTRAKTYKDTCHKLDFRSLNRVIQIDPERRIAIVEPRVTMEELAKATLPYGLVAAVVPEFKNITVGGAIMGGAAESSSHRWGIFSDACNAFEILCGDGSVIRATPYEHQDVFYGIPGSYGSLGALVLAEIKLVPAKEFVHLKYHFFSEPSEAIERIKKLTHAHEAPDFLDGMVFSKDLAVVVEGNMTSQVDLPQFSQASLSSKWYYQHAENMASKTTYEEKMTLQDYLFRYDQGAFWMGAYLFRWAFFSSFITQGLLGWKKKPYQQFNEAQVEKLHKIRSPSLFSRAFSYPLMSSKQLWTLLHKAEDWVLSKVIVQDFCMPESTVNDLLYELLDSPGIFPLWICPIKGTKAPQVFAPHLIPKEEQGSHFINIGVYGMPATCKPIKELTAHLEQRVNFYQGRKVLYSESCYTEDEFWKIYSREIYEKLRAKTSAEKVWHDITDKVLS